MSGGLRFGPIAVRPDQQGQGIGASLIRIGLDRLRAHGANGCVLVGDPGYYGRLGFRAGRALRVEGVPSEYALSLPLAESGATGEVTHHAAFFPGA